MEISFQKAFYAFRKSCSGNLVPEILESMFRKFFGAYNPEVDFTEDKIVILKM